MLCPTPSTGPGIPQAWSAWVAYWCISSVLSRAGRVERPDPGGS